MKLTDLDAEFIRWEDRYTGPETDSPRGFTTYLPSVETLQDAQGVEFDCPVCKCGHRIQVAFKDRGVLDHHGSRASDGRPTRWSVTGTGLSDLTLSPSIDCTPSNPNCWHGFVVGGEIR